MRENPRYFSFLYLFIVSCGFGCIQGKVPSVYRTDTLINEPGLQLSAVYLDSAHYRFEYRSGRNSGISKAIQLLPAGIPHVNWHDKDFIYLTVSCGTVCVTGYILPLNGKDTLREYLQPFHTDPLRHLIMFDGEGNDEVCVEDYLTGRRAAGFVHHPAAHLQRLYIDSIRTDAKFTRIFYNLPETGFELVAIDISGLSDGR